MPSKFTNEFGHIIINEEVVAQISGMTAMECYGIVGMAARNVKDGIVQVLQYAYMKIKQILIFILSWNTVQKYLL